MSETTSAGNVVLGRLFRMAIIAGAESAVRLHIERGDDLSSRDEHGLTALMIAASRNKAAVCQLLIEAGSDLYAVDRTGRDALRLAIDAGALDAVAAIDSAMRCLDQTSQTDSEVRMSAAIPADHDAVRETQTASAPQAFIDIGDDVSLAAPTAGSFGPGGSDRLNLDVDPSDLQLHIETTWNAGADEEAVAIPDRLWVLVFSDDGDAGAVIFDDWEAEAENSPPPEERFIVEAQVRTQQFLTAYVSVDPAEDWNHFDAFLPDQAQPLRRAGESEKAADLRVLLLRGIREGSIPAVDVEASFLTDNAWPDEAALSSFLLVLADLGVETDERLEFGHRPLIGSLADAAETDEETELVEDALKFFEDVSVRNDRAAICYAKDLRNIRLLSADDEVRLASSMDDAAGTAMVALGQWLPGIRIMLQEVNRVRAEERTAKSIFSGHGDSMAHEPDYDSWVEDVDLQMLVPLQSDVGEDKVSSDVVADEISVPDAGNRAAYLFKTVDAIAVLLASSMGAEKDVPLARALESLSLSRTFLFELASHAARDPSEPAKLYFEAANALLSARNRMASANLRLVISIAKQYQYSGLPLDDLVQEGNLGLLKAVDRFDWRRGYKFSTMACWWIRQGISRSVGDDSRIIRLPIHSHDALNRIRKEAKRLSVLSGREPSVFEISERLSLSPVKVRALLTAAMPPASIDASGDGGVPAPELNLADPKADPFEAVAAIQLRHVMEDLLEALSPRLRKVLRLRFGFGSGDDQTLEALGNRFEVTRERIRQIEATGLRKLRGAMCEEKLRDWIAESTGAYELERADTVGQVEKGTVRPDIAGRLI